MNFALKYCVLILAIVAHCHSQSGKTYMCGARITEALSIICEGIYNAPLKKASGASISHSSSVGLNDLEEFKEPKMDEYVKWQILNAISKENEQIRANMMMPFQQRFQSLGLMKTRFRRSPGIVEECCLKGCTIDEMQDYCA
ncbi:PREDICTED: LIRP [Nicrophorus vespilloides]|uniref:LIRP n=1 Tax=Nicrophorus vespilloides TaxID=110193 RepID=A0ABM1NJM3_NICVS|nr:PREDICTED: LIRP [Nicrophorus vespilloides]